MRVSDQLKKSGKVTRGRIGVQIGDLSKDVAESLGLKSAHGAEVSLVEPGSPADLGGIKVGDIILNFNGNPIDRSSDLPRLVGSTALGSKASVTIWRKGAALELTVAVAELEADKVAGSQAEKKSRPEPVANSLGLSVTDLSPAKKRELQLSSGVLVEAVDGLAARAGLQPGDVILQFNNSDITDARQFNALVAKLEPKKAAVALVRRGEASQFVALRPSVK